MSRHAILAAVFAVAMALCGGCGESDQRRVVTLWHQMRPQDRAVLRDRIADFETRHPQIRVRALYKETEELRVGVASAVLAGTGPELVYGPSDVVGIYVAMAGLRDMSPWFTPAELAAFDPRAVIRETLPTEAADDAADAVIQDQPIADEDAAAPLVFLGDRFGNHLALVYNRNFIKTPPQNTDELVDAALANTVDEDGDGQPDRYGIVWNYTEPFFVIPFLTGFGSWVFDESGEPRPALDTAESVAAYQFVSDLHQVHHVLPASSDYEAAAALFLANRAAMIIDGDWSWQNYVSAEGIDAAVAPLPVVASTGRPMAPMIAAKGFCLTVAAKDQAAEDAMQLVRFLTSAATQQEYLTRQRVLPSRLGLWDDPEVADDPTLQASVAQLKRGRLMPHDEQMRAVWDAMRPAYQQLMGGQLTPAAAARNMQQDAVTRIELMTRQTKRDNSLIVIQVLGLLLITGLFVWQFKNLRLFVHQWRRNWIAYLLVLPSVLIIFLTVLFPFVYNVLISFSDMSLRSFRDWQLVGLANYRDILTGDGARDFWWLFMQTIAWTVINVTFHVVIGVFLAVLLNGQVVGKSLYRVVLVIPWAVPAYITAISWRGMFDSQFGSVNHVIAAYNGLVPGWLQVAAVNWLGTHGGAFAACSIANVWLGFPFMMIIALGGLQGIPAELYEAARIDRASRWMQFRHITLPLLKPVLLPSITLGVIWTFNNLNIVWLVSNGGEPGDSMHILVSRVYKDVFNLFLYGRGAAFSMVIFVILLGFAVLFLRRSE